jgi:hypothetical protein
MHAALGVGVREKDVLGDREVGAEIELLEDDADALGRRVMHGVEDDRLAVHAQFAGGRGVYPGEDLHQGRLAGAVFADERGDSRLADGEIGVVERDWCRGIPSTRRWLPG